MLEAVSADHLGEYGYKRNVTPNIDLFADKSIIFSKAYSHASHSDYSQTSFLSSRYTLTSDYRNNFEDYPRKFIWDILKEQNYTTAYISSQDDYWANMINYYNKQNLDLYSHSITDEFFDYGSGREKKDYDEKTLDLALKYLNNVSVPFFLYVNFQATHYPYSYPEDTAIFPEDQITSVYTNLFYIADEDKNSTKNKYDNALNYVDKNVGGLLNFLELNGYSNNSIIILTSDHGETLENVHGGIRHGFGVYEEETHVPLIIYVPGQGSYYVNESVAAIDVVPTVLSFSNFSHSKEFQGKEMIYDRDIFLLTQNQNYKIGLIKGSSKCVFDFIDYGFEFYNKTIDPKELNDIAAVSQENEEYKECVSLLLNWHNCQIKYYKEKKWLYNETINCAN